MVRLHIIIRLNIRKTVKSGQKFRFISIPRFITDSRNILRLEIVVMIVALHTVTVYLILQLEIFMKLISIFPVLTDLMVSPVLL